MLHYIVFICHVIGTRHAYESQISNDGPKCEKCLRVINFLKGTTREKAVGEKAIRYSRRTVQPCASNKIVEAHRSICASGI